MCKCLNCSSQQPNMSASISWVTLSFIYYLFVMKDQPMISIKSLLQQYISLLLAKVGYFLGKCAALWRRQLVPFAPSSPASDWQLASSLPQLEMKVFYIEQYDSLVKFQNWHLFCHKRREQSFKIGKIIIQYTATNHNHEQN